MKNYLTIHEVAKVLRVSPNNLYLMLSARPTGRYLPHDRTDALVRELTGMRSKTPLRMAI